MSFYVVLFATQIALFMVLIKLSDWNFFLLVLKHLMLLCFSITIQCLIFIFHLYYENAICNVEKKKKQNVYSQICIALLQKKCLFFLKTSLKNMHNFPINLNATNNFPNC